MDLQEIMSFYVLTQGEIDKLWEFYIVGHLAIIGWLVTVDVKHIERVRRVLAVGYIAIFGVIYFFFFEAYCDMVLIQNELILLVSKSGIDVYEGGYVKQLLSTDIMERLTRVSAVYAISLACTLYMLFSKAIFQVDSKSHN